MTNQSLKEALKTMWKNTLNLLDITKSALSAHISNTDNPHKVSIYDIGAAASGHTHNYAGSSSAGGAANSANKLNTNAGSATNPVYFSNGIPVKTTYTLGASVPSGAKFTDTTYSNATTSAAGLMSATDKTNLDGLVTKVGDTAVSTQINSAINEITPASIGAAASSHTHSGYASTSHTHNYAGSSSAGGAANSVANSMIVQLNSGTTEGTNKFTFNGSAAKSVNITPSTIGAAASSHGTHVSYSSTNPVMDGTASVGSASTVARSDHKHPTDTTRAAASDLTSHTGNKSNPHGVTLSQLGITATATELNYCDGVTSNIQTQLNNTVKLSGDQTISGNKTFSGIIYFDDTDASIKPHLYTDDTNALKIQVGGKLSWIDPNGHFKSSVDGMLIGENTLSTYGVTGVKGNAESSYRKGNVNITPANIGAAASSHTHSASNITAGTLGGSVVANATAVGTLTTKQVRNITISTADPTSSDGGNGDVWITYGNTQSDCPFPVGGVYISIVSTDPSSIWAGTTWEQFAKGRTLVGLDSSDPDFTTAGHTDGKKTHTLTPDEIPAHGHGMAHTHSYTGPNTGSWKVGSGKAHTWCTSAGGKTSGGASKTTTDNAGGGSAHNNLQPYIVVYMWKRVS